MTETSASNVGSMWVAAWSGVEVLVEVVLRRCDTAAASNYYN